MFHAAPVVPESCTYCHLIIIIILLQQNARILPLFLAVKYVIHLSSRVT